LGHLIKDENLKLEITSSSDVITGQGSKMMSIKLAISMSFDRRVYVWRNIVISTEAIKFGRVAACPHAYPGLGSSY